MIDFKNTQVMNLDGAVRGMRQPMQSHEKSDSHWSYIEDKDTLLTVPFEFFVGDNDLDLMKRLCKAGSDHRKFLRQIFVSVDITSAMYWWKEFDTYKIATVANSTSTMHKIHAKEIESSDFSMDHMNDAGANVFEEYIAKIEEQRKLFVETKDRNYWYTMIQMLPSSYNQTRTVTLNYEVLFNMYHSRKNHKLWEWHCFCDWCAELPYFLELYDAAYKTEQE